jgi:hypothetical protein
MMKRAWILILMASVIVGFSGMAGAELTVVGKAAYNGKDYKLIYDSDLALVWLDYSNSGLRWPLQMSWVSGLNEPGVLTYTFNPGITVSWKDDWRLPKSVDGPRKFSYDGSTTAGFNITSCELGHLYYISLGNLGYYDTEGNARPGWGLPAGEQEYGLNNTGPFDNLISNRYWSSTEYAANPIHAWAFNMVYGMQINYGFKAAYSFLGIAVRPATIDKK